MGYIPFLVCLIHSIKCELSVLNVVYCIAISHYVVIFHMYMYTTPHM